MSDDDNDPGKIKLGKTTDLGDVLKSLDYATSYDVMMTFAKYDLLEVRKACLDWLEKLGWDITDENTSAMFEDYIRQLDSLDSKHFGERLLNIYVFHTDRDNDPIIVRAIEFAISLTKVSPTGFLRSNIVSKIICSRLSKIYFSECYNNDHEPVKSAYDLIPSLRDFLTALLDSLKPVGRLELYSRSKPHSYHDFTLAMRALKVIVHFAREDQSFLPQINELIMLHQQGIIKPYDDSSDPFALAVNLAALKQAAKLLRRAQEAKYK